MSEPRTEQQDDHEQGRCEVLRDGGGFCGNRAFYRYPVQGGGWMRLCISHGQAHEAYSERWFYDAWWGRSARHAEALAAKDADVHRYGSAASEQLLRAEKAEAELTTLREQLAAMRQRIEAALKQLMADALAAKLTATDAADVAYVARATEGYRHPHCRPVLPLHAGAEIMNGLRDELEAVRAANVTLDTENAMLRQALRVIKKGLSDSQDGEFWTARKWLDRRGIYHGDLSGERVLFEVAKHALGSTPEPQTVCVWTRRGVYMVGSCGSPRAWGDPDDMAGWKVCPYCTLPLTLSPEPSHEEKPKPPVDLMDALRRALPKEQEPRS